MADEEEQGPPYAVHAGGAVGGTPAEKRAKGGRVRHGFAPEGTGADPTIGTNPPPDATCPDLFLPGVNSMRITGYDAIAFAEREGLTLNKMADPIDEEATGLTVAEAEAIAADRAELIWLEVSDEEYYEGPRNMEPGR